MLFHQLSTSTNFASTIGIAVFIAVFICLFFLPMQFLVRWDLASHTFGLRSANHAQWSSDRGESNREAVFANGAEEASAEHRKTARSGLETRGKRL